MGGAEPRVPTAWQRAGGDAYALVVTQQWMFGPDVLVAPVVTQGAMSRRSIFRTAAGASRTRASSSTARAAGRCARRCPPVLLPVHTSASAIPGSLDTFTTWLIDS